MPILPGASGALDVPEGTFDNFLIDASNRQAYDCIRHLADGAMDLDRAKILMLCGPSGCGKSHLLRALTSAVTKSAGPSAVTEMSSEGIRSGTIEALRLETLDQYLTELTEGRLLLVDQGEDLASDHALDGFIARMLVSVVVGGTSVVVASSTALPALVRMSESHTLLHGSTISPPTRALVARALRRSPLSYGVASPKVWNIAREAGTVPAGLGQCQRLALEASLRSPRSRL